MLLAPALNDDLLYESRLNAIIFAFSPFPKYGARCLRRFIGLLARIRQMHTLLRRGVLVDAAVFARQLQWYRELAYIAHPALLEVGRSEQLLSCLSAAGNDRRAYGMKGRHLFFLALDQPRKMCLTPPFGNASAVEDVTAFIDLVKEDIARIEVLCDIGSQLSAPFGSGTIDLNHPTRCLLDRNLMSLVSPIQSKMITIYQFSDAIIGAHYEARGRLIASFVIDLYGATLFSINSLAVALKNEADHDCVVLRADTPDEMARWVIRVNRSLSALSTERSHWMHDNCSSKCVRCCESFSFSIRRHHCRRCGALVCNKCSNQWAFLTFLDRNRRKRICASCFELRKYVGLKKLSSSDYELIQEFLDFMERNLKRKQLCVNLLAEVKMLQSDLGACRKLESKDSLLWGQLCDLSIHLESMYSLSSAFVNALSHWIAAWKDDLDQNIGELLSEHARFFGELSSYICDLNDLTQLSGQFRPFINDILRPIRHVGSVKDAAARILESTPGKHVDFNNLSLIVQIIQDCASASSECISRFEGSVMFAEIELKFAKQISLYRPGRAFVSEGFLQREMFSRKTYSIMVFSDLIMISKTSPTGLIPRWRIETLVDLPCVRQIDGSSWRLSWLSSCITFEPLQSSLWVNDVLRITSRAAHSFAGAVLHQKNWVPDSADSSCSVCSKLFSMIVRRHHCRHCGDLVCHQCSTGRLSLTGENGLNVMVRVCDRCRPASASNDASNTADEVSDDEVEVEDSDCDELSSANLSLSALLSNSVGNVPDNWMCNADANSCLICDRQFTIGRRRHHCRECGALVCNLCSTSRMILEHISRNERVRVCDRCAPEISDRIE